MNNLQENKLNMYRKVKDFLNRHSTETVSVPAIAVVQLQLHTIINHVMVEAGKSSLDITGYTIQKSDKRTALNKAILKISQAYSAWCFFNENIVEAKKFDITPAALEAIGGNDIYTYAQLVNATATKHISALAPFNTNGADFTKLNILANEFLLLKDVPKHERTNKKQATQSVKQLFAEADKLIKLKLDNLIDVYRFSNPNLHQRYKVARIIEHTGHPSKVDLAGAASPASITVASNIPYKANRSFRFNNNGEVPLTVSLSNAKDTLQGIITTISPGKKMIRRSDTLNKDASAGFLLIENADDRMAGSYEVSIGE